MMPIESGVWNQLSEYYEMVGKAMDMRKMFNGDPNRFDKFSVKLNSPHFLLDYSKNLVDDKIMKLLFNLARENGVEEQREKMFNGATINVTENRAVLHTALRNVSDKPIRSEGTDQDVMPEIRAELSVMRRISEKIRSGSWIGYSGKKITDVINIGIGGSDLGPVMVCEALKYYSDPSIRLHFVSNVDGTHLYETLRQVNPDTTLFIIVSKTFTTAETMANANSAKEWFLTYAMNEKHVCKHFIAISTNSKAVADFGIASDNMVKFWDWVGGRYSLWSAVGLVIMISIGSERFMELLAGAHTMDNHFRTTPLEQNMPVILALLGIWYNNFHGAQTYAILPYEQYLHRFPAYLQQGDMESNGKSTSLSGDRIKYQTGPVVWGEPGTNGQHAFFQLLHQGTKLIPADFIVGRKSLNPIANGKHHRMLVANCIAQSEALMVGKTSEEVTKELASLPEPTRSVLVPHKTFSGNHPTTTLIYDVLNPFNLGALIALYEHKIFVQGVIWHVNSFDQWGVELGKQLANVIVKELETGKIGKHDGSTETLVKYIVSSQN